MKHTFKTSKIGNKGMASEETIEILAKIIQERYDELVVEYNKDNTLYEPKTKHSDFGYPETICLTDKYDIKLDNKDLCSVYYLPMLPVRPQYLLMLQGQLYDSYEEQYNEAHHCICCIGDTVIKRTQQQDKEQEEQKMLEKLLQEDPALQFVLSFKKQINR